jgi:DNA-directed RNA polymerase specialized sigma24 family protein
MTRRSLNDRCTSNDYRRLFAGSAERLRWLCYILTGNQELSEKLLDAALEQSLKGSDHVFREWMVSWARRLIIRVCIDTMRPRLVAVAKDAYLLPPMRLDAIDPDRLAEVLSLPAEVFQDRLLEQDVLSRFVFVLRALEGYSRRETSLMLDIDDRSCEWVYLRTAEAMEVDSVLAERSLVSGPPPSAEYFLAQAGQ